MRTCRKQRRRRKHTKQITKGPFWSPPSCPDCRYIGSIHDTNKGIVDIYLCASFGSNKPLYRQERHIKQKTRDAVQITKGTTLFDKANKLIHERTLKLTRKAMNKIMNNLSNKEIIK